MYLYEQCFGFVLLHAVRVRNTKATVDCETDIKLNITNIVLSFFKSVRGCSILQSNKKIK